MVGHDQRWARQHLPSLHDSAAAATSMVIPVATAGKLFMATAIKLSKASIMSASVKFTPVAAASAPIEFVPAAVESAPVKFVHVAVEFALVKSALVADEFMSVEIIPEAVKIYLDRPQNVNFFVTGAMGCGAKEISH